MKKYFEFINEAIEEEKVKQDFLELNAKLRNFFGKLSPALGQFQQISERTPEMVQQISQQNKKVEKPKEGGSSENIELQKKLDTKFKEFKMVSAEIKRIIDSFQFLNQKYLPKYANRINNFFQGVNYKNIDSINNTLKSGELMSEIKKMKQVYDSIRLTDEQKNELFDFSGMAINSCMDYLIDNLPNSINDLSKPNPPIPEKINKPALAQA